MPIILYRNGWKFFIVRDHNPPHVHAWKGGVRLVVTLDPVDIRHRPPDSSPKDERYVKIVVHENRELFMERWNEINPRR